MLALLESESATPERAHLDEFFGSYQLIEIIGSGGTARVFRARHIHPQYAERSFAVKILHSRLLGQEAVRSLFRNEGYFLSLIQHPNIVLTHEAGIESGQPFVAMEYVDGASLAAVLDRATKLDVPLTSSIALHIMGEVLVAMAFAHSLTDADGTSIRVVHRDLNPANIFLSFDGDVKVGDFGVAVIAGQPISAELAAGTPGHFAPEQLQAGPLEQTADVYALGILMYELVFGRTPFDSEDKDETIRRNRRGRFTAPRKLRPDADKELERIVLRALERKPHKRYPNAAAMLEHFNGCVKRPLGMRLAVRSMLRTLFSREHMRALTVRAGLAGQLEPGHPGVVETRTTTVDDHKALANMLATSGLRIVQAEDHSTAGPRAVLVDTRTTRPSAEQIRRWAQKAGDTAAPVVIVATALDAATIELAHASQAIDVVREPLEAGRLHTALWSALLLAEQAGTLHPKIVEQASPHTRVLLVSSDDQLATGLKEQLDASGYYLDVVASLSEAVLFLGRASVRLAMYDWRDPHEDGATFAAALRAAPGIGVLPILYLCEPGASSASAQIERSAACPRNEKLASIVATLAALHADFRQGRAFSRFKVQLDAEMTYGGRVFQATATDLSRGGAMLKCVGIPPVGADVAMTLHFDNEPVRMRGHVLRVAPGDGDVSAVGIRISSIASEMEARLIRQIQAIEESLNR